MLSRRSLLTAAGASGIGLTAAACGSSSGGSADEPVDIAADAENVSGDLTLLTPAFSGDAQKVLQDEIVASFTEANPDVNVKIDYVAWDKLNEKLSTSIAGGLVADVIMAGVGWTPPFAHKKILAELPTDFVDGMGMDSTILTSAKYDGSYYSIPHGLDCRVIVYNKEMFEAKGISEPPTSMEEFAQIADELTGDGVVGLDLLTTSIRQAWIHLLYAHGGQLFSEDGLTPMMQEQPGADATQWILDRMDKGSVDYDLQAAEGQPTPFMQGKAAMQLLSTNVWPTWKTMAPELTEEGAVGMFVLPGVEGVDPVMFQGGNLISVGARSQNQPAAAALVKHMLEPEMLVAANVAQGVVPPRQDLPANEELDSNYLVKFAMENLDKAGAAEGGTAAWMEIRGNLQPIIEACLTGQADVQTTMDEMKKLSDDAIARL